MSSNLKPLLMATIILFLLFEIVFSFKRHYYFPIDGDLPAIVLPDRHYQKVLSDPFGLNVILHDSIYPAPNRFFAHWAISNYFKQAPLVFQKFVSPVKSVYVACAFAKTIIQFFLIYLMAVYATGKRKIWSPDVMLAAAIVTPLFQIFGYNIAMGIIDHSITYTFFYAFALSLPMLFLLPFFNAAFQRNDYRFSKAAMVFMILLAVVLSFNGALNTAVILIVCPVTLIYLFFSEFNKSSGTSLANRTINSLKNIPPSIIYIFGFACVLSLYSLYIGKNNSENLWETIPMAERYARLPKGLYLQFTETRGLLLLLSMILINTLLIKIHNPDTQARQYFKMLKWFFILSIVYVLLLPLGGYRSYRFYIIRMDTIMPVTLGMMLFYGFSTFHIIKRVIFRGKVAYYIAVVIFSVIFINADSATEKQNICEKNALEKISRSTEEIILLEGDCSVMSWGLTKDYRDSEVKTELLRHWGIIKEKKFFYQQ
jgi:hypothetical protein